MRACVCVCVLFDYNSDAPAPLAVFSSSFLSCSRHVCFGLPLINIFLQGLKVEHVRNTIAKHLFCI